MKYPTRPGRLALIAAAVLALPALAQTSPDAGTPPKKESKGENKDESLNKLDTVVVNARGRTETLQSVPVSVKAFSAQAITDAGIKKPGDFVALAPNLSMAESESVGQSFMTIRGLSQVRNGEAPMAVVVDGVTQSNAKQFTQELFDVQSIEVLRGPQGALYGRNATGGAILIKTKQPTNDTEGFVSVGVGTGSEKVVQGAVSGALIRDTLLYRLAGSYTDRGGYIENRFLKAKSDPYQDKTLRGLLTWNVTQDLTLDLRTNFVRDTAGGAFFNYQPTHINPDCSADPNNLFDMSRVNANYVVTVNCFNNRGSNTRDLDEVTLKADYGLGFATLTGVFSHNKIVEWVSFDQFPYTGSRNINLGTATAPSYVDGGQSQYTHVTSDTYELRLTSPNHKGMRWMGGIYGMKTHRFVSSTTSEDLGKGLILLTYDPAFDDPTNPTSNWSADNNHNKASAVFGNVDFDLTPKIELSLAARYDRDERRQIIDYRQATRQDATSASPFPYTLTSSGLPPGCSASNAAACAKEATYSAMQPKVSLRYKADDGSLLYGSVGKGFRSGQFNQSGLAGAAAKAVPPVNGVTDRIAAEGTTSAELGYKTTFADGKVQLNAALYNTEVRNAPYFVFIASISGQAMVPLNKVNLRGGELELVAKLAPGLDAYAGLGVTKSRIKQYDVNPALVGNQAPYVPNLGWNLGAQYAFQVAQGMSLKLRGDVVTKGKQYWDPENSTARDQITLLNLRAALEDSKGKWSTSLGVNNATDKVYNAEYTAVGFSARATPRIVRLDARYNF